MAKTNYEKVKQWRERNPEMVALQRRRYQIKNWDKIREYQKKWQAKRKNAKNEETTILTGTN